MKNALVLSGGGAKGAFQIRALEVLIERKHVDFEVLCGVSVGASGTTPERADSSRSLGGPASDSRGDLGALRPGAGALLAQGPEGGRGRCRRRRRRGTYNEMGSFSSGPSARGTQAVGFPEEANSFGFLSPVFVKDSVGAYGIYGYIRQGPRGLERRSRCDSHGLLRECKERARSASSVMTSRVFLVTWASPKRLLPA